VKPLLVLVVAAGCGRIDFDLRSDGGTPDAPCTWSAFSAPAPLPGPVQSPIDDWIPTPTAGGLQLFMHTYRSMPRADIWTASRSSTTATWSAASEVLELVSPGQLFSPTLTDDGLRMILADSRSGMFKLYEATRASPTAMWRIGLRRSLSGEGTTSSSSAPPLNVVLQHAVARTAQPTSINQPRRLMSTR